MILPSMLLASNFSAESIRAWPLWQQGLFVVVVGLVGVFLVLLLFFLTIFIMQKITESMEKHKKDETA